MPKPERKFVEDQDSDLHGARTVTKSAFGAECGNNCPAAINTIPLPHNGETKVECAILNAILAGDTKEIRGRMATVLKHFGGREQIGCPAIKIGEKLTAKSEK